MGSNTAENRVATLGTIQIVHINGTRQGEIEHFLPGSLSFGRHPTCDIVFPRDALSVSRLHARLECNEHHCRLLGIGGNGTYVNGELVDNVTLKTGDVVTFSQHGPKLSFIFQPATTKNVSDKTEFHNPFNQDNTDILRHIKDITPVPGRAGSYITEYQKAAQNQASEAEFTLLFDNQLRHFKKRRIYIGAGNGSDFVIDHPRLLDQHALLYFSGSHCFITNTTALKLIWLNDDLVVSDTRLCVDDVITLNSGGPCLIYKGEGKFQPYQPTPHQTSLLPTLRESAGNENQSVLQKIVAKIISFIRD